MRAEIAKEDTGFWKKRKGHFKKFYKPDISLGRDIFKVS